MELVEKSHAKVPKRKERYVAFRTATQVSTTEHPFLKILLMLDLVMVCAKIAEVELKKNIIRTEDYWRV